MLVAPLLLALSLAPSVAAAEPPEPKVGMPGKDVIWVPTPEPVLERMLAMARVTPADLVVDLGAGDGRMVIAAAVKHGARGRGVEFNSVLVEAGRRAARKAGLKKGQVEMVKADLFTADIRDATVVMLYLLPDMNLKLRTKLLNLRPGTRIVAHQFGIPDWEPDETSWWDRRAAFLWIVPAKIAGGWRITLPNGQTLDVDLEQTYQRFRGRAHLGEAMLAGLRGTRLEGDAIAFSLVDGRGSLHAFHGKVGEATMAGEVEIAGTRGAWTAVRRR
jgi:hypothetical protein